jgi:hypothetical protein
MYSSMVRAGVGAWGSREGMAHADGAAAVAVDAATAPPVCSGVRAYCPSWFRRSAWVWSSDSWADVPFS